MSLEEAGPPQLSPDKAESCDGAVHRPLAGGLLSHREVLELGLATVKLRAAVLMRQNQKTRVQHVGVFGDL